MFGTCMFSDSGVVQRLNMAVLQLQFACTLNGMVFYCLVAVLGILRTCLTVQSPFVFLRHFDKLNYDIDVSKHSRHLRSVTLDADTKHDVILNFNSRGRNFTLVLKRDSSVFSNNHVLYLNDRDHSSAPDFLYSGTIRDDPGSSVFGSIIDGIFDGQITTGSGDVFHVEKAVKYYGSAAADLPFHSIIYHSNEVDETRVRRKRSLSSSLGCGLHGSVRNRMEQMQTASIPLPAYTLSKQLYSVDAQEVVESESPFAKYLHPEMQRHRRQSHSTPSRDTNGIYNVRTCSLYMQTDQKLWDHVFNHEGQRDRKRTQEEIITLINNHIKAVNAIYESTDYENLNGFNFVVQRTTIYDDSSCPNANDEENGNPFCQENVDVSNYLNRNSIRNHSDFCLAYALTFRDFDGGTLGLAWVASPNPSVRGGICEIYQQYTEGTKHVKRSLNTGIITLVNYNNRVPPKVSQLTLAHEIGHNFGSPHDYPSPCVPGLPDGNYIMFASATSGDKPNNARFSPCSIRNISSVLRSVLSQPPTQLVLNTFGGKRNCFQERKGPFCGNQLVEEGEQCDCGFDDEECKRRGDMCCYARQNRDQATPCTRRLGVVCSPSEGFCCTNQCSYSPKIQECRDESECTERQFCTGQNATCPESPPKPEGTVCADHTKMCRAGVCNASICETIGMDECFLTVGDNSIKCHLACMPRGGDPKKDCKSSFNLPQLAAHYQNKTGRKGILLRPGSPCDNFNGYCDVFHKCRSVDSNGPLSRLKQLFSPEALENVSQWVQRYWWAVVLMGIALMLFMALFIKCCAVHTPSSNPRKPPAHSIYETLRHPSTLVRQPRSRSRPRTPPVNGGTHGGRSNRHRRSETTAAGGTSTAPVVANGVVPSSPPQVAYMEQPPPYSAVIVEPSAAPLGVYAGPPRGHRKKKTRSSGHHEHSSDRHHNYHHQHGSSHNAQQTRTRRV